MIAARNLDWSEFIEGRDHRFEAILDATASGETMEPVARRYGCSLSTISGLKRRFSAELQESFGEDILLEVSRRPEWQSSIRVERERVACRADRRRH
jgi:transposase-like protein